MKIFCVYILASKTGVLYAGVSGRIARRVLEHKAELKEGFSKKYKTHSLVYYDKFGEVLSAIRREKQIKAYRRSKKVELIDSMNREWDDLARDWYDTEDCVL